MESWAKPTADRTKNNIPDTRPEKARRAGSGAAQRQLVARRMLPGLVRKGLFSRLASLLSEAARGSRPRTESQPVTLKALTEKKGLHPQVGQIIGIPMAWIKAGSAVPPGV